MAAEHVRALGERIRLRREELGMTQDEVARQMKGSVDGQRVSKWERGENRPRDESLEDLARVLQTSATALLVPVETNGETPDLSRPAPDRLEQLLTGVEALLKQQNDLLARQSQVLERIESAIAREARLRAETEEFARLAREVVAGRSHPADAPSSPPVAQPTEAEGSSARAAKAAK